MDFYDNINKLQYLNTYLNGKTNDCIKAFDLLTEAENIPDAYILTFTYENLELGKIKGDKISLNNTFNGITSKDEIDGLLDYDYDEDNALQEHIYYTFYDLANEIVMLWVKQCFTQSKVGDKVSVPFYFKFNFDDLYIYDLKTLDKFCEKQELQTYYNNNLKRAKQLLVK